MKKLINKINSKVNQLAIRTKTALASKSGEGYIYTKPAKAMTSALIRKVSMCFHIIV